MCPDDGRRLIILGNNKELKEKTSHLHNDRVIARPADEKSSLGVLMGLTTHLNEISQQIKAEKD